MNPLNYYAKALADTLESHMQPCAFAVLVWNEVSVARVVGAKHVVVGELLNYQRKFGKKHLFQQNAFLVWSRWSVHLPFSDPLNPKVSVIIKQ